MSQPLKPVEIAEEEILAVARIGALMALRTAPTPIKRQAEDVFQEACIGALKAARRFKSDGGAQFATYAAWAARGKAVDMYRRGKYPKEHAELDPRMVGEAPEVPSAASQQLVKALGMLPDPQGRIIALVHLEGCRRREVAEVLEISLFAVERCYVDGMRALKAYFLPRFRLADLL